MGGASNMFLQETISISHFCALHANTKKKKNETYSVASRKIGLKFSPKHGQNLT